MTYGLPDVANLQEKLLENTVRAAQELCSVAREKKFQIDEAKANAVDEMDSHAMKTSDVETIVTLRDSGVLLKAFEANLKEQVRDMSTAI